MLLWPLLLESISELEAFTDNDLNTLERADIGRLRFSKKDCCSGDVGSETSGIASGRLDSLELRGSGSLKIDKERPQGDVLASDNGFCEHL